MPGSPAPTQPCAASLPVFALVVALGLGWTGAVAQSPAAGQANATAANPITRLLMQRGVQRCAARIDQVAKFLGFNDQGNSVLMLDAERPDQHLLPLSLELSTHQGGAYVSASFAPGQANGCGAVYEAVSYWPQGCEAVAAQAFSGLKALGRLQQDIAVLDAGMAAHVFLMKAGTGCVSIKKERVL